MGASNGYHPHLPVRMEEANHCPSMYALDVQAKPLEQLVSHHTVPFPRLLDMDRQKLERKGKDNNGEEKQSNNAPLNIAGPCPTGARRAHR